MSDTLLAEGTTSSSDKIHMVLILPAVEEAKSSVSEKRSGDEKTLELQSSSEESVQKSRSRPRIVVLMLAPATVNFLAALTTLIITTSLPVIPERWKATDADCAWIASAYYLGVLSTIPFWGKVSDIFGRKAILVTANVVFLIGNIVAATSVTLKMLIAGRAVQGLGGGGILTLVSIWFGDLFSMRFVLASAVRD